MNDNIWILTSADSIAIATTLILAALGALFTERSGVLNLGIEGVLLTSAISAFLAADASGSIWLGLIIGSLAGAIMAAIHAVLSVVFRANQIVAGLALVIFGTGLANFLGKPAEGKTVTTVILPLSFGPLSDIPVIGPIVFGQDIVTYFALLIAVVSSLFLFRTRPGLELRATGDYPATVDAQGLFGRIHSHALHHYRWAACRAGWQLAHAGTKCGLASGLNHQRPWLDCSRTCGVRRLAAKQNHLWCCALRLHVAVAIHIAGRTDHHHPVCIHADASVSRNPHRTNCLKPAR